MDIYILRHGLAGDASDWAPKPDGQRPLTSEGRKKIKRIAKILKRLDISLDVILSSPYTRARQTAEIVAKTLRLKNKLSLRQALAVDGHPAQLLKTLQRKGRYWRAVLLVGHEPYLSRLISEWTCGEPDGMSLTLKKGGLCKLTATRLKGGRCATLEWLVPPKVLLG